MAARLAIAKTQRILSAKANVHLWVRNFQVINSVGAANLNARLDCDSFASAHRATSHYDRASFVGLAWRPKGETICCGEREHHTPSFPIHTHTLPRAEVYSTGRANLPGSTTERALQESWRRMLPQLLEHTTASRLLERFPEYECRKKASVTDVWMGWKQMDAHPPPTETPKDSPDDATLEEEDEQMYGIDDDTLISLGL